MEVMEARVLAGRYRLECQLGQGGMGSVWRAEHLALHSAVAVKLMDPALAATPGGAERFRREAQAAASLRSAHVVQVLDYGVDEGTPFLVMELLTGESLASCLERERRLAPHRTLEIMTQVARAMTRAHGANIVHRDLKPDNIFLVREDDQELAKVLDFGIAKTPEPGFGGPQTRTGVTMGTPHYMSPEQAEGKRAVDQRSDLWAMAVIVCECITGVRPFRGETWGELLLNICARPIPTPSEQASVPAGFDAWFARATNRDPEQRFGTAQELVGALREVIGGSVAQGAPAPTATPGSADRTEIAPGAAAGVTAGSIAVDAPATIPMKKTALPLAFALGVLAVGALGGGLLLMRRWQTPEFAAQSASSVSAPATEASFAPPSARAAAPPVHTVTHTSAKSPPVRQVAAAPVKSSAGPSGSAPSERPGLATALPSGQLHGPVPSAAEPPPPRTPRCFTDPFTGVIKADGSGPRPAGAQLYACRQNPFTGQYQKQ